MRTEPGIMAPSIIGLSWLAAAGAYPGALLAAAVGQAVGALAGGCQWIGISLPLDRPVWALVNQPVINFSSLPSSAGYWLGSLALPVVLAVATIPLLPRGTSLLIEIVCVQWAWCAAVVAVAWLPLLEPRDGHLGRWLALRDLSPDLLWAAPGAAAAISLLPTLRLLELTRRRRSEPARTYRLAVAAVHLGGPAVIFGGLASWIHGRLPMAAAVALLLPVVTAFALAWFRFPEADIRRLALPGWGAATGLAAMSLIAASLVWFSGRPVGERQRSGILWAEPNALNNIRPWIEPLPLTRSLSIDSPSKQAESE
jgi:hypothetical protein